MRITRTEAGFKLYFYKNLYEELIKAAIEGNVVDIYASPYHIGVFCAHNAGSVNYVLSGAGYIDPYILEAVFITAGIKDSVCVNADHVAVS